ncbi:MAG: dTDP-4-dehydrorhamnose 3,5-epimerase [Chloroflexota bacterium]|nr:dTDP-4-dehydrorhamnose 3,5-epimerase [Chloroflexota bacterium]
MIFHDTAVDGCVIIDVEPQDDDRGLFARTFDAADFERRGLHTTFVHCSVSYNRQAGTLRGLHFQAPPHEEVKLIRCVRGRVFDVVLDARPESSTYARWVAVELDQDNRRSVYVPTGCAHGFVTLADGSELTYSISMAYVEGAVRGVRWNDADLAIPWPIQPVIISARDRTWPPLRELAPARHL